MTSQSPSTTVKVPPSASNYTAATLDPELRSSINSRLLHDGHVTKIQEHLLHALHANNANWPTAVSDHALSLLRSGEITTFPALLKRVLEDVRTDTLTAAASSKSATANGETTKRGVNGASGAGAASLALPKAVVDEAMKVTRECLDSIVEVEETGTSA